MSFKLLFFTLCLFTTIGSLAGNDVGHGQTGSFPPHAPGVTADYYMATHDSVEEGPAVSVINFVGMSNEQLRDKIENRIKLIPRFAQDYLSAKYRLEQTDQLPWILDTFVWKTNDRGTVSQIPNETQIAYQKDDTIFIDAFFFGLLDPYQKVLTEIHEYIFNVAIHQGWEYSSVVRRVMKSLLKDQWRSVDDLTEFLTAVNQIYRTDGNLALDLGAFSADGVFSKNANFNPPKLSVRQKNRSYLMQSLRKDTLFPASADFYLFTDKMVLAEKHYENLPFSITPSRIREYLDYLPVGSYHALVVMKNSQKHGSKSIGLRGKMSGSNLVFPLQIANNSVSSLFDRPELDDITCSLKDAIDRGHVEISQYDFEVKASQPLPW